jgi:hypothetical protein
MYMYVCIIRMCMHVYYVHQHMCYQSQYKQRHALCTHISFSFKEASSSSVCPAFSSACRKIYVRAHPKNYIFIHKYIYAYHLYIDICTIMNAPCDLLTHARAFVGINPATNVHRTSVLRPTIRLRSKPESSAYTFSF